MVQLVSYFIKNILTSFDDDDDDDEKNDDDDDGDDDDDDDDDDEEEIFLCSILMHLQIVNTYIYTGYPKLSILEFWSHGQNMF